MTAVLASLGLTEADQLQLVDGDVVGRLTIMHSDQADVIWADATGAEVEGRCTLARTLKVKPVAGDWVALTGQRVTKVFARRNELRRTQTHGRPAQVLAANIDLVLIIMPLNAEMHHRMLEGLVAMVRDSGARPVVVVSKVDESLDGEDVAQLRSWVTEKWPTTEVIVTSSLTGEGVEVVRSMLTSGVTAVLLGASGAGKTSLLNALEGHDETTRTLSRTGEGRHATTTRKLYRLSSGGVLLDIPGIRFSRAVADQESTEQVFDDIAGIAAHCRFANCGHRGDLGCAVEAARVAGDLTEERVALWREMVARITADGR